MIPIYTEPSTCVRNEVSPQPQSQSPPQPRRALTHTHTDTHARARTQPVVLVTDHTDRYRQLARTQIAKMDAVVEIGSDLGLCTAIMAEAVHIHMQMHTHPKHKHAIKYMNTIPPAHTFTCTRCACVHPGVSLRAIAHLHASDPYISPC